jgi:hypothetical protein
MYDRAKKPKDWTKEIDLIQRTNPFVHPINFSFPISHHKTLPINQLITDQYLKKRDRLTMSYFDNNRFLNKYKKILKMKKNL